MIFDCISVNVVETNQPPVANAGPDQTAECSGPDCSLVSLDGSGSSDLDGDALSYSWSGEFGTAGGPAARPRVEFQGTVVG